MENVWKKLRYFKPEGTSDNWGNPYAMDPDLLLILDDFRHYLGVPVYVTAGNGGKHSENSFHYIKNGAKAVDVVIPDYPKDHMELFLEVLRTPFTGIGYYPHWWWKDPSNIVGGFHLDTRPFKWETDGTQKYRSAQWIGIPVEKEINGKLVKVQEYLPMTYQNLITYGGKYGHFKRDIRLDHG